MSIEAIINGVIEVEEKFKNQPYGPDGSLLDNTYIKGPVIEQKGKTQGGKPKGGKPAPQTQFIPPGQQTGGGT